MSGGTEGTLNSLVRMKRVRCAAIRMPPAACCLLCICNNVPDASFVQWGKRFYFSFSHCVNMRAPKTRQVIKVPPSFVAVAASQIC